jgi:glycosyltransferase involved in cell wall biosynthesis
MKPKILFIAPQPFLLWRGSPLRVGFNVRALSELGFDVDLAVMPFGETPADLPAAVTVHRPRNLWGRSGIPIGPSLWKALYDIPLYRLARRLAQCNRYTAIHGVEEAGLMAGRLGRRQGVPAIYEKHSDPASYRKGFLRNGVMSLYARMEEHAAQQAAAVIATGAGLADQVRARFPDKPVHAIADIPSSLVEADDREAARLRARLAPEPEHRLAAYVGSFAVYQGIDLLFAAIPQTVARFPGARFLIVGGSHAEIAQRRREMETAGVGHAVHFAGCLPPAQLPHWLRAADVLLSPRAAGVNTPLKILDYMKVGRPIVAADSAANRLLLDETVARTTPARPDAFAAAVADLMRDDELRARMGIRARARIAKEYSYPLFRERLRQCYEPFVPSRGDD